MGPGLDPGSRRVAESTKASKIGKSRRGKLTRRAVRNARLQFEEHRSEILLENVSFEKQRRHARDLQQVLEFGRCRKGRQCHCQSTRHADTEKGSEPLGSIRHQYADARVLADTARNQRASHCHRALPQLAVGPTLNRAVGMMHDQRIAQRIAIGDLAQITGKRQRTQARLFAERDSASDRQQTAGL